MAPHCVHAACRLTPRCRAGRCLLRCRRAGPAARRLQAWHVPRQRSTEGPEEVRGRGGTGSRVCRCACSGRRGTLLTADAGAPRAPRRQPVAQFACHCCAASCELGCTGKLFRGIVQPQEGRAEAQQALQTAFPAPPPTRGTPTSTAGQQATATAILAAKRACILAGGGVYTGDQKPRPPIQWIHGCAILPMGYVLSMKSASTKDPCGGQGSAVLIQVNSGWQAQGSPRDLARAAAPCRVTLASPREAGGWVSPKVTSVQLLPLYGA